MKKRSILVVEDEMIVAEDLKHRLTAMGYDVPEPAGSSEEALCRVEAWTPDLILMDIVLEWSSMDGIETARRILAQFEVPVIFVTAFADDITLNRAKTANPFAYSSNPSTSGSCIQPSNSPCTGTAVNRRQKNGMRSFLPSVFLSRDTCASLRSHARHRKTRRK